MTVHIDRGLRLTALGAAQRFQRRLATDSKAALERPLLKPSPLPGFGLTLGYTVVYLSLIVLIPVVGVPRVVAAAPNLGLALGYDVVDALEHVGHDHLTEPGTGTAA